MRMPRIGSRLLGLLAAAPLIGTLSCGAITGEVGEVTISVHLHLQGETADFPATMARVLSYAGRDTLQRGQILAKGGSLCSLDHTPDVTCEYTIPKGRAVTLIAAEGSGDVDGELRAPATTDTVHSARYLEFVGFSPNCTIFIERGTCVFTANTDVTVDADFRYMAQVVVYQVGAAALDFYVDVPTPTLKLPGDGGNNINGLGCVNITNDPAIGCDHVHAIGGEPVHRFTVWLPHNGIVVVHPFDGAQTFFLGWDGPCSSVSGGIDCLVSFASPDALRTPIVLTLRYGYWQCPGGVSDHDDPPGACTLVEPS